MDRCINYVYGSSAYSEFVYTETQDEFFFTVLSIPFNNWSEYPRLKHKCSRFCNVGMHFDHPNKRPVCTCVYVSQAYHYTSLYQNCMSHVVVDYKYVVYIERVY
jgi:hypothetical protein